MQAKAAMPGGGLSIHKLNASVICYVPSKITSNGIWVNENPLHYSFPLLALQGGVILGPSVLGRSEAFASAVFPERSRIILDPLSWFSLMLYLFLIGVKMDPSMITSSGKRAVIIGFSGMLFPAVIIAIAVILLYEYIPTRLMKESLIPSAATLSLTSFPVVICLLEDLKILNSEVGRLAVSAAMITDLCSIIAMGIGLALVVGKTWLISLEGIFWTVFMAAFMLFVAHPSALWVNRQIQNGQKVKQSYIFIIFVVILVSAYVSEVIGQHAIFGPFILGLAIPDGPPLGAIIVERLDPIVTQVFFPLYFAVTGMNLNLQAIKDWSILGIMVMMVLLGFMGKIIGTMVPCIYYRTPLRDAISLGLVMNAKGIMELIAYNMFKGRKIVDNETYAVLVAAIVVVAGATMPLLQVIYKPSVRYVTHKKRTIQHAKSDAELRILSCIYKDEDVPAILSLLDTSNPTMQCPIIVFLVHLVQLVGRAAPLLIANTADTTNNPTHSDRIANAFRHYEQQHQGHISVYPFTAVAPYATMHDDICSLALSKNASLIIVPFHKKQMIDGTMDASSRNIRSVNRNVLNAAPCSVGILIDRGLSRGHINGSTNQMLHRVAMIFLGGRDDREALAYAVRMAGSPRVSLTLVRILSSSSVIGVHNRRERMLDDEMVNILRVKSIGNDRVDFRVEVVSDGEETISLIQAMGDHDHDLFIVGRGKGRASAVTVGLTEWSECPELGLIGDFLASSDFANTVSVLVVQQQLNVDRSLESIQQST
ncbi:cation/H(+) antiporter 15-like isoform X2 [Tasmannia lanceolata]|uniref:cation/H(+) antiporter 15-like isoform X2 n=1 Tax=Tasmannia lanceolata TaxID=3420 RepID=UPI004062CB77